MTVDADIYVTIRKPRNGAPAYFQGSCSEHGAFGPHCDANMLLLGEEPISAALEEHQVLHESANPR